MGNLEERLENYFNEDYLPMHMPGHKRNIKLLGEKLPYRIDITEIDGFDDLHHPEGIIKEIEEKAKKIYKSNKSFILVNGSTCGILAGIRSVVNYGDKVVVARNSHKSVYNAIELNGLNPIYVLPKIDEYRINKNIETSDIESILEKNRDIKLVIITSPTYEGVLSDIKTIVNIAHKYKVPVLVDEAHGAHLNFMKNSNYEALNSGADIVIQSLHKTLPALTGTAILHIQGDLVKEENIRRELSIFETSSPSYILMSSIDECLSLIESNGKKLFLDYQENLKYFYNEARKLKKLKILGNEILNKNNNGKSKEKIRKELYDFGKIVIITKNTNITGKELADILREDYKIEIEMSSTYYIIAMTSICDNKESFERLLNALKEIDLKLVEEKVKEEANNDFTYYDVDLPRKAMPINEALNSKKFVLENYKNLEGKISKEYIFAYPPGIPIITPGEVFDKNIINIIENYMKANIELRSTFDKFPNIEIVDF